MTPRINTGELQVGNYLHAYAPNKRRYEFVGVVKIDSGIKLTAIENESRRKKGIRFEPITINHDLLFKLGFVRIHSSPNKRFYRRNGWLIELREYEPTRFHIEHEGYFVEINSLHQLQNLYFNLTGDSLELIEYDLQLESSSISPILSEQRPAPRS